MSTARPIAATGLLLTSLGLVSVSLASPALAVCDAYSRGCPDTAVQGTTTTRGGSTGVAARPSTLPFTGGELVLLSTVGAAALVGGTALVVAGRRKGTVPA